MADKLPAVGVVMGSQSDMEIMQRCFELLDGFSIPYEVRVISAHRTPEVAHEYAATAAERGLKVIIAAAGMSAALAGVLAAKTTLPVIGVPINSGPLAGMDAALSTMQMPPGVPVGCMAIGKAGAANAAVYAAQLLAIGDLEMVGKIAKFKKDQAEKVKAIDAKVSRRG